MSAKEAALELIRTHSHAAGRCERLGIAGLVGHTFGHG